MYSFPNLEPVCCSMSGFNCCFLTCIQISQEVGEVVWCSRLLKNLPQFVVIHTVQGFSIVNEAEVGVVWICGLVSDFICGELSVIIVSNIYHFPFSHSEFPIMCMLHLFSSPADLEYSVLFSLFTFCFSVLAVSIEMSSDSEISSSAMSKTNESIKGLLHSCYSDLDL